MSTRSGVHHVTSTRSPHTQISYLRGSSMVPSGLSREMSLCYKSLKHIMVRVCSGHEG